MYLGFFEFVHNVRRRGRALLGSLLDTLLQPVACPQNQPFKGAPLEVTSGSLPTGAV